MNNPVDLDISADQRRAWSADTGGLLTIELESGTTSVDECPYAPAALVRMAAKSVFLITAEDGDSNGIWSPETASRLLWQLPGKNKGE